MTASFLPPLSRSRARPPHPLSSAQRLPSTSFSSSNLAPPNSATPNGLHTTNETPSGTGNGLGATSASTSLAPNTPNPFPSMRGVDAQYAHMEGQVVWEAEVLDEGRIICRSEGGGWEIVWRGEVPVGEFAMLL